MHACDPISFSLLSFTQIQCWNGYKTVLPVNNFSSDIGSGGKRRRQGSRRVDGSIPPEECRSVLEEDA